MPELPEVEWVRRDLQRSRPRGTIVSVYRSRLPLRIGAAWRREKIRSVAGRTLEAVTRRGKHLVIELSGDWGLLVHLGMSGRIDRARVGEPRPPHTHLELGFEDGGAVRFVDPRRFGGLRADALGALFASPPLSQLGPEPLTEDFSGAVLRTRAGRSTRAIWEVLLDQRVVAGIGNIYALEALFHAGIHPLSPAARLRRADYDRLAGAIREVLEAGLASGGTTLQDYRRPDGRAGEHQSQLFVYGRAGESCRRCGAVLRSVERGGRRGVFCPAQQRRGRRRPTK